MRRRRATVLAGALLAAACVEQVAAPGSCPAFCPTGAITIVDTLLTTAIAQDSAFRGYVRPHQASVMLAATLPGIVDGRALFTFAGLGSRFRLTTTDTSTGAITRADSARLLLEVTRRDSGAHNLTLRLFRMPVTMDSTTTFDSLAPRFADSLVVHTVNLDTLLARPGRKDSISGDSVSVDTVNHLLVLSLKLDSTGARYVRADSGAAAYGVRVAADARASIAIGKGSIGPSIVWYFRVDSVGKPVARTPGARPAGFQSFVFTPPAPPIDSTLAVGGVPSARSILRVAFPRFIRDSSQIIRGTLVLVPAVPARGAPVDSFTVEAHTVLADFGAKSPIALDATRTDTTVIRVGATDTVKIEVTNLLQFWAADSTRPPSIVLRAKAEGTSFAEIRFYPSKAQAFRPRLQVTFVRRFPFGAP
jgi:hypothetical protein